MKTCDLCSIETIAGKEVSAADFRRAVEAGLTLPESEIKLRAGLGLSREGVILEWRKTVSRNSTNWLLCPDCHLLWSAVQPSQKTKELEALTDTMMAHFRGKQANVEQWLSLLEQNVPRWPDLSLTERNECTKGVRLLSDPSHFSCFGFKSAEVRARFDRILAAHASVLAAARAESVKSKKWWQFWIN